MSAEGDDRVLAARLIEAAMGAGADAADAIVVAGTSSFVGVADRALEEAEHADAREAGLRVLAGGGQACVSTSDLRDANIAEMAARAVTMARAAPPDQ